MSSLEELEGVWGDVEESSFGDIPDGRYQVQITAAVLNHSKSSGRFQCSWQMKIVSGEHKGRMLFKHDGMEDETNLGWFRGGLARLGIDWPEKATDIPDMLEEEVIGTFAEVTARTKGDSDIQNVYFNRALDSDDVDAEDLEDWSDDSENEEEDGEEDGWEIGHRCVVEIDGADYTGEINGINDKEGTVSVAFDDGDEGEYPIDDLKVEEGEEEESGGDDGEDEEEDEGDGGDGTVEVSFTDDDLNASQKKAIKTLATSHEFDPYDYESYVDLLCDIAEHLEVAGSFDKVLTLIKECKAKTK